MTRFRWLVLLLFGAVAASGYFFSRAIFDALIDWLGGESEITVRTAPVRRSSMPATLRVTGELSPGREAIIVSRLPGKVTAVRFNVGDSVPAGTIVANVHSAAMAERMVELRTAVDGARKDSETKNELAADAEKRLAKSRELYQQDLIARRDVTQAETVMNTVRAEAELARAKLAQQEAMLAQVNRLQGLTRLSAPMDGVVTHRWVEPGATIAESAPILSIANLRTLKFVAKVSGAHSRDVRNGMKVEISSLEAPGAISVGNVGRVESLKAAAEPIAEIEILFDNSNGIFRPGMAATGLISLEQLEEALLLPRAAVISVQGRDYIYKLAGNRAVKQEIALGNEQGDEIEIRSGLKEGDPVIVDKLNLLKAGSSVRVLATRAPPPAK
ncbi:MAG TPA: efflux RND transporter periplasmic adaptor subunit [Candidatus Binatia bacterium]|jgi:RND family efflux transporter MFP subunit